MAVSFCDEFGIDKAKLTNIGALDVILDFDTKYFIDPALLRRNNVAEFVNSASKVEEYFANIVSLIRVSKSENDMYWKKADDLLTFKEIKGTCLGYSNSGTSGNAIGSELRQGIIKTVKDLLINGDVEPVIFELLGVFQENVGCDRISDLVTFILKDEIELYTKRVLKALINIKDNEMLINPYNKEPVLLLPMEILSPLPVAEGFDDIDIVCAENDRIRDEINAYFDLRGRKKLKKREIRSLLINNISFRQQILEVYKNMPVEKFDFEEDKVGRLIWYETSKQVAKDCPLYLTQPQTEEDILDLVKAICNHFKSLVEENGLWRLLYDNENSPKHESAAQLLFFGIADAYCKANNIDISREPNNGQGPVDFKLSKNAYNKVLVEIKLTSNPQILHGIKKQLPIYMKQENAKKAIYLVIENGHPKRFNSFQEYYVKLDENAKEKISCIYVDGNVKESASRA